MLRFPFPCWEWARSPLSVAFAFRDLADGEELPIACRRSGHFSLLAQRKVTKRNGLV
jgi:hypothetical protein